MVKTTTLLLLLLVFSQHAIADEPTAEVDRTTVAMKESFTLTVTVPGSSARNRPDMGVIENDFEVVQASEKTTVNVVNGVAQARTEFFITLKPKRVGELQIPALKIGGATTQALTITVTEATLVDLDSDAPDLFLEASVPDSQFVVQGQITYVVRLFLAVDIREGSLSEPELRNAVVIRLGDDVQYQVDRFGRSYHVVERRFAIFPEISGTLSLPPPVFKGQLPENREFSTLNDLFGQRGGSAGNAFGNFFHPTQPVSVSGPELTVAVNPVPEGWDPKTWLPAAGLELLESWTTKPLTFKVGEPTTRTVTVRARGVTAAHLPDIAVNSNANIKVYADRPSTHTSSAGDFIVGERTVKHAIVPTQAGPLTLPAVVVEWWDTTTQGLRTTELPAREVAVLAAEVIEDNPTRTSSTSAKGIRDSASNVAEQRSSVWPVLVVILIIAWLITFVAWLRARNGATNTPIQQESVDASRTRMPDLRKACLNNDAKDAAEALLVWAGLRWSSSQPRTLMAVASRVDSPETSAALMELDGVLYDAHQTSWASGAHLWSCLKTEMGQPNERASAKRSQLPSLYPDGPH